MEEVVRRNTLCYCAFCTLQVMATCLALLATSACEARNFGGVTARDAFANHGVAALAEAAADGNIKNINQLTVQGVPVNGTGRDGITPLAWAIASRNMKGAEALLRAGANPNARMTSGDSPMSLAVGGNQPGLLEMLLRHGGNPNLDGPDNEPLVHIAVRHKVHHPNSDHLDLLLRHGGDINADHAGSAADTAATLGHFDIAVDLLKRGLSYDLDGLARTTEMRVVRAQSEAQRHKEELIRLLKARGIQYPPPPVKLPPPPVVPSRGR